MPEWLDKAKDAAKKAADEAKKLAEAAKNADYGAMLDKTKTMAMQAAEEAKKAADNIMKKENPETKADYIPLQDNPSQHMQQSVKPNLTTEKPSFDKELLLSKIAQVEKLLQEIKLLLK